MQRLPDDITYLLGREPVSRIPLVPYSREVCEFLARLSEDLLVSSAAEGYSDVKTFGFWCRKGNLSRLKTEFEDHRARLGRGVVFHVTPSNVPVSFAFSYAFGLLSGNSNIVRVPSRKFPQIELITDAIARVFSGGEFSELEAMTCFMRYDRNDTITARLSAECDARIMWGGDQTIRHIRSFPVTERAVEIVFPDRYSLAVIGADAVAELDEAGVERLASHFYNDTYLMDQNACSSPHLVVWNGGRKPEARKRFWPVLLKVVERKYELAPIGAVERYSALCEHAILFEEPSRLERHGGLLYRIAIDTLPESIDAFRGRSGLFYEYDTDDLSTVARVVNTKYQTLTYFGLDKFSLSEFVLGGRLRGIDRIVPIGRALDMDVVWDGYDIVGNLSRIIDVQ